MPVHAPELDRPFASRPAFLLNRNARSVSHRLAERLGDIVPQGDLFLSRSMDEAERFARTILRRGYSQVYVGGGDGTLVHAINVFDRLARDEGFTKPHIGLLKLGTGNAVAGLLGAKAPLRDADHVARGGEVSVESVDMLRSDDGTLTPFAGMGYDGAVLNDYIAMQDATAGALKSALSGNALGYLLSMATRTLPRKLFHKAPTVRVTSTQTAYYMKHTAEGDVPVGMPAGTVLYDGPAPMAMVGTVPFYGFGLMMFPFARKREGYMQLRIGSTPPLTILKGLWPRLWNGTFRHPDMHDFLLKDVEITSSEPLDLQVGGDAAGMTDSVRFSVAQEPVEMLTLGPRLAPEKTRGMGFLPAPRRA